MKKNKLIKVFTDNLPIKLRKDGKKSILWNECTGYEVKVEYLDNIELIKIIKYNRKTQIITFEYNNKSFDSSISNFINGNIGKIFNLRTSEFKIEIGTRYQDNNRDITIIDREYRQKEKIDKKGRKSVQNEKWYKYHCNKCGWCEGWMIEHSLIKTGCSCCSGYTLVQGINDIPTTAPWMVKYFQGGYEEAKLYTKYGYGNPDNPKGLINPQCPDCGTIKTKKVYINNIYKYNSIACPKCGDGISTPNKIMFNILEQLHISFLVEYSPDWIKPKAYDFYFKLNDKQYIIEMDGGLGHGKKQHNRSKVTVEESLAMDNYKDEMAKLHDIEIIRIDCDYGSNDKFEYIKQNILNNKRLNELFDLDKINWIKVKEFCLSSRMKEACDLWNNGIDSTIEIGKIMKLNNNTISKYLKNGAELKYCDYTIEKAIEHKNKIFAINNLKKYKSTINIETGYICESASEFSRKSVEIIGVKLTQGEISKVCRGEIEHTKGYTFKYLQDLTEEEIQQIQEQAKLNQAM